MNRSISQILRSTVKADQKDWVKKCPMLEFAINSSINKSMGFTPFKLDGGYMPSMIRKYKTSKDIPLGVCNFADKALQNLLDAHNSIIELRVTQKHHTNK